MITPNPTAHPSAKRVKDWKRTRNGGSTALLVPQARYSHFLGDPGGEYAMDHSHAEALSVGYAYVLTGLFPHPTGARI